MDSELARLTVAIMAGGKSSRMGTDKSFVPFKGKLLIDHVISRTKAIGREQLIITNEQSKYASFGLPTFSDIYLEKGPLGGLHSALFHASNPHLLIVACDMPWLNRRLLEYMVTLRHSADAVIPRWHDYPEPLHAIYSKSCLEFVDRSLVKGNLKMTSFHKSIHVRFLDEEEITRFDNRGISFANLNTPEDLTSAEKQN
jgi:molybdopterin-guanine dinucleotide biosynthesis protein A